MPREYGDGQQEMLGCASDSMEWATGTFGWATGTPGCAAGILGWGTATSLGYRNAGMGLRKVGMGSRNVGMHDRIIPGNVRRAASSTRENQGLMGCFGLEKPLLPGTPTWSGMAAPSQSSGHCQGRSGCSSSSRRFPWEVAPASPLASPPGILGVVRAAPPPSLGAHCPGISRSPSSSWLGGQGSVWELPGALGWVTPATPDPDSLRPVGPEPAAVPGGPEGPLWEDSLPVRDRSWFSSLRQLGCLGKEGWDQDQEAGKGLPHPTLPTG